MLQKDVNTFFAELREAITGDLSVDTISKIAYSVDASIYEIEPIGIVLPRTPEDIVQAIHIAAKYDVPVIARGAATGITGGCIGKGLIIDTSKYLNQILSVNYDEEYAVCEPGVVQDQLNQLLAAKGYRLGPDTSTGNRATLGGMMANNAAGARSLLYGKMVDHVLEVDLALANGQIVTFGEVDDVVWRDKRRLQNAEGNIYREIYRIRETYRDDIEKHFPKIPRRVSGYNLDELVKPGPFNVCKLITGSEGSLGIATKIKVRICKKPKATALCVVHFLDMVEGLHAVLDMLKAKPISLEMIDEQIITMGREAPAMKGKLEWIQGHPACVIVAEFDGDTAKQAVDKAHAFEGEMKKANVGYAQVVLSEDVKMASVWEVRKAGLGLLLSRRTYSRAIAFIEDLSIGPDQIAPFMDQFLAYLKKNNKQAGIYGHVGSGCIHVRPYINLRDPAEARLMQQMMLEVSDMILAHGGALSGEHGDGLIRSWLNEKMFGKELYRAFVDLKKAFDPMNRMNPGKVVHGPALLKNLRTRVDVPLHRIDTFQDFSPEGGFELAVDLCNGNGMCRKKETVMCPSFHASGNEYDTTRARAQALRAVVNGRLAPEMFTSDEIRDVLDLCLECKGCKTECPSQVDMAKMKAEFLYHYQEKHGYSLRNRLFGHVGRINALFSPLAKLFNTMGSTAFSKRIMSWLGIAPERELPALALERFSQWLAKNPQSMTHGKAVVLYNDTYTEYNEPEIGIAAVKVLNALGYDVIVPSWRCCGRPMISKGMLKQAREAATSVVEQLQPHLEKGLPIIGLEPSCILTIKSDFRDLLGANHASMPLLKGCTTFDEFVAGHLVEGRLPLQFKELQGNVLLHGHCHQKSLVGTKPTLAVLRAVPGFTVSEIDSGCCGMAGSFGYEKEHYAFSMKIGELKLFPAVRSAKLGTWIVADGISCRSQIAQGTKIKAQHLAVVLAQAIFTG